MQVAEPTGVASNYWDSAAPVERAKKRVAKQKIRDIQDGELNAAILPDGNIVSVVPDVGDAARKEKTKRTGTQRISEKTKRTGEKKKQRELDAALLPDGNVVSLVPDVGVVARKEKTKRTATQRRTDLEALMENQRLIDEASNRRSDEALTSPTGSGTTTQEGSGKPKV